jgi:hypothetical protein
MLAMMMCIPILLSSYRLDQHVEARIRTNAEPS